MTIEDSGALRQTSGKLDIEMPMNKSTKLKLLMPVIYATLAIMYFVLSWPAKPLAYHFAGVTITLVAFAFWLVARVQLGNAFSVAPKASYLVQSGVYSKLRHPVYYFSIAAVAGIGLYVWSIFALVPTIGLVLLEVYRIQKEEKLLEQEFGKQYTDYKQKTWF